MISNNIIGILTSTLHETPIHPWVLDMLSMQHHQMAVFRCHNEPTRGELALRIRKEFRLTRCEVFDIDFVGKGFDVTHTGKAPEKFWNVPTPGALLDQIQDKKPDFLFMDDAGNVPSPSAPWTFWQDFARGLRGAVMATGGNAILLQVKDRIKSITFAADFIAKCNLTVDGFDVEVIKDRIGADNRKMRQPR